MCELTNINVHALLESRRQVAVIWGVEDIQEVRPDLDEEQSWEVLQQCGRWQDSNDGFTWEFIEATAEVLFPE